MRRLNYDDVIQTELQTKAKTDSYLKGVKKYEPIILDTFFQLMYFTGKKEESDHSADRNYHTYCWHQYYHSGYSLRACFILYERGYYLEANIILRRLLELLVKMKYLKNHKDQVATVWMPENFFLLKKDIKEKKKKIRIKDMFNEVAPEAYPEFYGLLLSGFTHGGIGSGLDKIDYKSTKQEASLGSVWNENGATFVLNILTVIALGFLNFFPQVFAEGYKEIDPDLNKQYLETIEWLNGSLENHRSKYPNSEKWHNAVNPLIENK
jgi:hypothetical protein